MKLNILPLFLTTFLFAVTPAFAWNMNSFQNAECPDPGGNQITNFQDGWHWVAGFSQNMWGKDTVNDLGNQNFIQCFCPLPHADQAGEKGIQSNWVFAGNLSTSEQQQLLNTGWQLRHDGTSFGLPQNDFLVKNFSFSCNSSSNNSSSNIKSSHVITIFQSNNSNVSTSVVNNQDTGGNSVNRNTGGNVEVTTGDVSSNTNIKTNLNSNTVDGFGQKMRQMFDQIRISITGNGATSDNTVNISHL